MIQTTILVGLLALVLLGVSAPETTVAHVHPVTLVLLPAAVGGFWIAYRSSKEPMWQPRVTRATVQDIPQESHKHESLGKLTGA